MSNQVGLKKTPFSLQDIANIAYKVCKDSFGENLSKEQTDLIVSQISLETAGGQKTYNNNVGNLKKTNSDRYDYVVFDTHEYEEKESKSQKAKFRAYNTLEDGVKDYLNLIHSKSIVWDALKSGDSLSFAHALKVTGYFTAPEEQYANTLNRVIRENKNIKNKSNKISTSLERRWLLSKIAAKLNG
jgi:flagellum-specific peptidoglycan hydrolase FlgJ